MLQLVSAFYYSTNVLNCDMAVKVLMFGGLISAGCVGYIGDFCGFLWVKLVGVGGG